MSIINFINFNSECCTEAYIFALSMFSKNFIAGNMSIFEDFNIIQIEIQKTNL